MKNRIKYTPKLSVIIPTYNRKRCIPTCIKLLKEQTLKDIEFIIVDDGSTDGTSDLLRKEIKKDKRFKLILNTKNKGPSYCRNIGLKYVQGYYIGFFDCDDRIPENYYERLYITAINTGADIVFTSYNNLNHKRGSFNTFREKFLSLRNGALWDKIYRSSMIFDNNIEFSEGLYTADNIFVVKSFYFATKVEAINEPRYLYTLSEDSIGKDKRKETKRKHDIIEVCKILLSFAEQNNFNSNEYRILKDYIWRSLYSYKDRKFTRTFENVVGKKQEKALNVSIIIPVYNALDDVKLCLASIKESKLPADTEIIIIDDCSDKETKEYLEHLSDNKIKVIKNNINLGFIKTCNKGMEIAQNDILVLLNSDTKIPEDFCTRILNCFNSNEKIQIASPISTNSQWFNIHETEAFDYKKIDNIAKQFSPKYPEITPEGFCLCLRKIIVEEIGYLDEVFGKGYCEEDDLVMRALTQGYKTVLIDNMVVCHKRHASFGAANRKAQLDKNVKIFRDRWGNKQEEIRNAMNMRETIFDIHKKIYKKMKIPMSNIFSVFKKTYRLFNFLPVYSYEQIFGERTYRCFGLPIFKVWNMQKECITKYYILNILVLKVLKI